LVASTLSYYGALSGVDALDHGRLLVLGWFGGHQQRSGIRAELFHLHRFLAGSFTATARQSSGGYRHDTHLLAWYYPVPPRLAVP
jgi:hypothetical protein